MKNRYLIPAMVFVLVFAGVLVAGLLLNRVVPVLSDGEVIPRGYDGRISTLTGFRASDVTGDYSIGLSFEGKPDNLAFITLRSAPDTISVNGTKTEFLTHDTVANQILYAAIPPESVGNEVDGLYHLDIAMSGTSSDELVYVSLCGINTADRVIATYNILMPMIYGILLTISFYGFLLYLSKRDGMLLLFSSYTFCIFLWTFSYCLMQDFGADKVILQFIYRSSFDFAVVLGMATCISFCRIRFGRRWRWLGTWYGLLAICIVFAAISGLLTSEANEVLLFAAYTAGGLLLIVACGKSENKPWVVLCGLAITQGLRMVAIMYASPLYSQSFDFALMKQLRLLTMPYLICCMIYISSDFASRFREAEKLSMELEQTNRELDKRVAQRTEELVKQQNIRTSLMMNIFHDLRTPLFIMRGCMDKLEDKRSYDEETVKVLDGRLLFITQLTEDLFSTVKLEDNSLIMETEPVSLDPMLQQIIDASRLDADRKGIGIVYRRESRAVAWGDETWLSRAFQNLIANAVYYSKQGGGDVRVVLRTDGDKIIVSVSDHGVGIAPEDQDKIFERYYCASETKKHRSSGLGLSIAAGVMAHHGGTITVDSKVGEGTTFIVTLPMWGVDDAEAPARESSVSAFSVDGH